MNKDAWLIAIIAAVVVAAGGVFWFIMREDDAGRLDRAANPSSLTDDSSKAAEARRDGGNARTEPTTHVEQEPVRPTSDAPSFAMKKDVYGVETGGVWGFVTDQSGQPIVGAEVKLTIDVSDRSDYFMGGDVIGTTATDANGRYQFSDIPTYEAYGVRALHPEFAARQHERLTFRPGEIVKLDITLGKGFTLSGTVVDEGGTPIEGVRVFIQDLKVAMLDPLRGVERETTSNAEGVFQLTACSGGQKNLIATKETYSTASRMNFVLDGGVSSTPQNLVLKRGLSISGRVYSEDRQPVEGAFVTAAVVSVGGAESNDGIFLPVRSGADGSFVINGLPEETFLITASSETGGNVARRNAAAGARDVDLVLARTSVVKGRVIDGDTGAPIKAFMIVSSPLNRLVNRSKQRSKRFVSEAGEFEFPLRLVPAGTRKVWLFALLPGYAGGSTEVVLIPEDKPIGKLPDMVDGVTIEVHRGASVKGELRSADDRPIEGARIALVPTFDDVAAGGASVLMSLMQKTSNAEIASTFSGSDGVFVVDGALAGRFALRIQHPDYVTATLPEVHDIPTAGEVNVGQIKLTRGGTVRGVVRDKENKQPEEGARVVMSPQDLTSGEGYSMMTSLTGDYEFKHVKPGIYTIHIAERKGLSPLERLFASGALGPQQNATIIVEEGGVILRDF